MGKQRKTTKVRYDYDEVDFAVEQLCNHKHTDRLYKRLDKHQLEYYDSILKNPVVMVDCPAGTGKTTVAVMAGLEMLRQGSVASIMYVRFPDSRYLKQGYLPGEQEEKEKGMMTPFYDAMQECGIQSEAVDKLRAKGLFKITTDCSLRGTNLKNTFLIIDEAQNGDIEDLRLVLTRLHDDGGRAIIIGHSGQVDNNIPHYGKFGFNAFEVYQIHMTKKDWAVKCDLPVNYRGKISKHADEIVKTIKELSE